MTGLRSWSEFRTELSPMEQRLLIKSLEQWHEKQQSSGGGSVGGMGPNGF